MYACVCTAGRAVLFYASVKHYLQPPLMRAERIGVGGWARGRQIKKEEKLFYGKMASVVCRPFFIAAFSSHVLKQDDGL